MNLSIEGWSNLEKSIPINYINRDVEDFFIKEIQLDGIDLIVGARQVGKSTLMANLILRYLRGIIDQRAINIFNFDYLEDKNLCEDTNSIIKYIRDYSPEGRIFLFIDEVQRSNDAGLLLKKIYDRDRQIKIIATGSSVIGIKESLSSNLAGRAIKTVLYPLSFIEILKAKSVLPISFINPLSISDYFDLYDLHRSSLIEFFDDFIRWGGYPKVFLENTTNRKIDILKSVIEAYINRDIVTIIGNERINKYDDAIKLIAKMVGNLFNVSEQANCLSVKLWTMENYIKLFEDSFVGFSLSPYFKKNVEGEFKRRHKYYFYDIGIRNLLLYTNPSISPVDGQLFENVVISEIFKALSNDCKLYYWRSRGGSEMDIVIKFGQDLFGVEVNKTSKGHLTVSNKNFIKSYNPKKVFIIDMSSRPYKTEYNKTEIYYMPAFLFLLDIRNLILS
jgi:hypothetical protein